MINQELAHKNSLFAYNRFSRVFFSTKMAESEKIVLVSCIIDLETSFSDSAMFIEKKTLENLLWAKSDFFGQKNA